MIFTEITNQKQNYIEISLMFKDYLLSKIIEATIQLQNRIIKFFFILNLFIFCLINSGIEVDTRFP